MRKGAAVVLLLIILGGAGYYEYQHGWKVPSFSSIFSSSSDTAVAGKVKSALSLSKRLAGFDIGVKSDGGVITLTGEVSSEDAKSLASEIAKDTSSVKDVKNNITVNAGAKPSIESSRVEDLEIKTSILEAIGRSPELSGKRIDVKIENRMVTLSGNVDTTAQKNGAEQVARATQGVVGVTNNLAATSPQAQTEPPAAKAASDPNSELAQRVEFELYRTRAFDVQSMKIRADGGVVTLSGAVRSRAEELLALKIAEGVDGVKKVVDELKAPAR
jgi:osmotically-inducible protein OsmY